jgi:hypothetical protein
MSGETEREVSGWTVDTLHSRLLSEIANVREHSNLRDDAIERSIEVAFRASEASIKAALEAAEKAVLKAEGDAEKRFESVNEFRAQLSDQAATFIPRTEAVAFINNLSEKLSDHTELSRQSVAETERRLTEAILTLEQRVSTQLTELTTGASHSKGSQEGQHLSRTTMLSWLGGAVTFMTLVIIIVNILV